MKGEKMTNALTQFDEQEFAQFLAWKKQMAEDQAKKDAERQEQESLDAVKKESFKIEDLVQSNEKCQKLNEQKVKFAELCDFTFTDANQALVATVFSFAQCLAANQRTTVMLKTADSLTTDFMHIYGSWA